MLFILSLLLLATPLPGLQTTTNEKRNSTGSDVTNAVLTLGKPKTTASHPKQYSSNTLKPNTANQTVLTNSTTNPNPPTINAPKTTKSKPISSVTQTTLSPPSKPITPSGTMTTKDKLTVQANQTTSVNLPIVSEGKIANDKPTSTVVQNIQSISSKSGPSTGITATKDKYMASVNQTASTKSPASDAKVTKHKASPIAQSVQSSSTKPVAVGGVKATKNKLTSAVNQTVLIKSPSASDGKAPKDKPVPTVSQNVQTTPVKPASSSSTMATKDRQTASVNQTVENKSPSASDVKSNKDKPASTISQNTQSKLTKPTIASGAKTTKDKHTVNVSQNVSTKAPKGSDAKSAKDKSSSTVAPNVQSIPVKPTFTNATVANKEKQMASVNQTLLMKTRISGDVKSSKDKPLPIVKPLPTTTAKPATTTGIAASKDKPTASVSQTEVTKSPTTSGVAASKDKPTASVIQTEVTKSPTTSGVTASKDKPTASVSQTEVTKSPTTSGVAASKDKPTASVSQTEVTKSPTTSGEKTTKDKSIPVQPIKVVISDGCESGQTKEQMLKPGSPLVMTHKISLVPGGCSGGCVEEITALKGRLARLEKEMSSLKENLNCPNDCSGNGKCEKGKCVCSQGFLAPDCSKCAPEVDCHKKNTKGKVKLIFETLTAQVNQQSHVVKENTQEKNANVQKTLFQKKDQKKDIQSKDTDVKPKVAGSGKVGLVKAPEKQGASVSKTSGRGSVVATKATRPTVGQVLLKHEGRKQEESRKGKITVLVPKKALSKTDLNTVSAKDGVESKANVKSAQLKDQPQINKTQSILKKSDGTTKVLTILTKVMETSSNKSKPGKETVEQSTLTEKNVTQPSGNKLLKKVKEENINVTKVMVSLNNTKTETGVIGSGRGAVPQRSQYVVNVTTVATADEAKVPLNKTAVQPPEKLSRRAGATGLGSVKIANVTSYSFTLTWSAPQGMFRNFTVTRREHRVEGEEEEDEEVEDRVLEGEDKSAVPKNISEVVGQMEKTNGTTPSTKGLIPRGKAEGKKVSMVLPGSVRSVEFSNLRPQMRYTLYIYGTAPGKRSKIHKVAASTAPELATELVFSNVTESSLTVSWSKPKSTFTGFRVTYTQLVSGESSSVILDSHQSHVVLSKLTAGSPYMISVTTIQGRVQSDALTSIITTVPAPPTHLQVVNVTDTRAVLQWTPSLGKVDRFIVSYESLKTPNVTVTVMLSGNSVEYQLKGLQRGTVYTVKALSQKDSLQSTAISITFTTASVVKASQVGAHAAVVAWKAPAVAFHSYRLTYQVAGGETKEVILDPTITEYKLTGLLSMSRYTVLVQGERDGRYSSIVTTEFITEKQRFPFPADCSQQLLNGVLQSGEMDIYPQGKDGGAVRAYCDMETDGGGWTVFQRRMNGKTDFYQTWSNYSAGFGNCSEEFWLGNELLHNLTSVGSVSLRVDLRVGNDTAYAHYSNFTIDTEGKNYAISVSGYTGTAGDSMKYHNGRPFSTWDKDPDPLGIHCSKAYMGGWWYKNCYKTNLNGLYGINSNNQGVVWIDWKGKDSSIPFTEMKLRPAGFPPSTHS